jgi:hypothetical protein
MVPFTKKNTLEQTGFKLTDNGFHYRGINYKLDDVKETRIYKIVSKVNTIGIGTTNISYSISILFEMKTGEHVQLTEQPTWLSNSKIDKVEQIQNIFNIVSEKTFQNRVEKYLTQVYQQGYFEYAGWRYYPEQKKIIDMGNNRAYSTQTTKFLRSYDYITVVDESDGLSEKIKAKLSGYAKISTLADTDVFYTLLKHFFSLEWK